MDLPTGVSYAHSVHPARPRAELLPCPACGKPTDALRAARIVLLDDRTHFLCSVACRDAFRRGERTHQRETPPPPRPSVPDRVREATRPRIDLPSAPRPQAPPTRPPPLLAGFFAVLALALAPFASIWAAAIASAALSMAAALAALAHGASMRKQVGTLAWAVGPAGVALAAIAALVARNDHVESWSAFLGAGLAALAIVVRVGLDSRAREPIAALLHALLGHLPARVRIPAGDPDELRYEEVPTKRIRTGEEILSIEGEVVGVDGVIQGGEASVLLHPGTSSASTRSVGDPILAGARVIRGAIRLLSTHVGPERALVRLTRFGTAERDGASIVRLADRVTRIGGIFALLFAVGGLALTGNPGLAGRLAAAAAVLIAAPLLSARRCAEAPLVTAAAAAARRGILFPDPRTLEKAGRVATTALCASGTITEGTCEVVDLHLVGEGDAAELLGLVAGAQEPHDHRFARAICDYARARDVQFVAVRRSQIQSGRGVTAQTREGALVIGNRGLLLEAGVSVALADAEAARAEERGQTALFIGLAGRVRGVLAIREEMHVGSRAAVQRMFDQRMEVVLLSGNHRTTMEAVAKHLDVTHVKAELLPRERGAEVKRLRESGGVVGVVGRTDGDRDAIEAADVAVILGEAGGPGRPGAITTTSRDVRDAAAALWIARAARSEAVRGVLLAVGAGAPLVAGAAMGWIAPGVAALFSVGIDAFALPVGSRLLRRIDRRIPTE